MGINKKIKSNFNYTRTQASSLDLMVPRLKLLFLISGILVLLNYCVFVFLLGSPKSPIDWGSYSHVHLLLIHGIIFIFAYLLLSWNKRPAWLHPELIDSSILNLTMFLVMLQFAMYWPNENPTSVICLLLFMHAAFIPCSLANHLILASFPSLIYIPLNLLLYQKVEAIHGYWNQIAGGYESLLFKLLKEESFLVMAAVVSIIVNRTLYSMRLNLEKAKRIGNYELKQEIGMGGAGKVFIAHHNLMCRDTAIKILMPKDADSTEALSRFEREVRLISNLSHPNTITIFDFGRTPENTFFYVMEYLEGLDLSRFVEKFGPLVPKRAVFIAQQICGSLKEAHTYGVIHRDIKPSNIFLTVRGQIFDYVKVLDFGLAKQLGPNEEMDLTKTGAFFGTPTYVAPESVYGKKEIDHRVDIYNLGAVLFWMLTGLPPFTADSSIEVLIDHVKTPVKAPSKYSELYIPGQLDAIVLKCMEKDPEFRYQSIQELEKALEAVSFKKYWDQTLAKQWYDLHMPELIERELLRHRSCV